MNIITHSVTHISWTYHSGYASMWGWRAQGTGTCHTGSGSYYWTLLDGGDKYHGSGHEYQRWGNGVNYDNYGPSCGYNR